MVAKNYCNQEELEALNGIVSAYLEFAEMQARRHIPMYMKDWIETLDGFWVNHFSCGIGHATL